MKAAAKEVTIVMVEDDDGHARLRFEGDTWRLADAGRAGDWRTSTASFSLGIGVTGWFSGYVNRLQLLRVSTRL